VSSRSPRAFRRRRHSAGARSLSDDASQDSDSQEGEHESSFAPPTQGFAKPQTHPNGRVESSSLGFVETPATSVSEDGTHSAPAFVVLRGTLIAPRLFFPV
jgi:hypothetical protein